MFRDAKSAELPKDLQLTRLGQVWRIPQGAEAAD